MKVSWSMKQVINEVLIKDSEILIGGKRAKEVIYKVRDCDFARIQVAALVNMYNIRETAHCKVIGHLLELSEHRHNIIPMTIEKFTKSLNSSLEKKEKEKLPEDQKLLKKIARQTVSSVLKDLEAIKAVVVSLGNIVINPDMFFRGSAEKRSQIILTFERVFDAS